MFLILTYHLQVVLHYSPLRAGLAVLPLTVANSLCGYQIGSRLLNRLAPRVLIGGGLLTASAGLAVLARLDPHGAYLTSILPAEVLVGVASAMIGTATQIGSSIGTAVLNAPRSSAHQQPRQEN